MLFEWLLQFKFVEKVAPITERLGDLDMVSAGLEISVKILLFLFGIIEEWSSFHCIEIALRKIVRISSGHNFPEVEVDCRRTLM